MAMSISVVIPTFNCGPLLVEAVQSVLGQTHPVEEVIVVDDGSTDATSSLVQQFGDRIRYLHKKNGGVSSARNLGIQEARGEWIAFLDADDVWHPRKLELQTLALQRRTDLGLLGTQMYDWPASHPRIDLADGDCGIQDIGLDELIVRNLLATSTIITRSETLRTAGPFDLSLHGPEDHDLWIRVAAITPVALMRVALTGYRIGNPGSLSKNVVRMEEGMRAILHKLEANGGFRGKPLLRRRAWGHYWHSCGIGRKSSGDPATAMKYTIQSLKEYPLPYSWNEAFKFSRLRLLGASALAKYFPRGSRGRYSLKDVELREPSNGGPAIKA